VKDVLLLDVTPLTLAIETEGGIATAMIPRNTTIPKRQTQTFSTAADNQPGVEVVVIQGERPLARAEGNKVLGTFKLDGIPPMPRGMAQIEVTFDLDANGILHVSAKEKTTGKEQKISIAGSSGLSKEEIEKAKQEAEAHAGEDAKRKEDVETKNQAETMVYQVEKSLKDLGDKVTDAQKQPITDKVDALKKAIAENDISGMKSKTEELQKVFAEAYQQMAQAGGGAPDMGGAAGPGPGSAGGSSTSEGSKDQGNVVDADFEVVDSDKKA
jgi:molecular chaperone DnaK